MEFTLVTVFALDSVSSKTKLVPMEPSSFNVIKLLSKKLENMKYLNTCSQEGQPVIP